MHFDFVILLYEILKSCLSLSLSLSLSLEYSSLGVSPSSSLSLSPSLSLALSLSLSLSLFLSLPPSLYCARLYQAFTHSFQLIQQYQTSVCQSKLAPMPYNSNRLRRLSFYRFLTFSANLVLFFSVSDCSSGQNMTW